jgi:hypothetical protein
MPGQPDNLPMDWRAFLSTSTIDVFETIENAIIIAATDFPDKFLEKKDYLMQTIITTALSHKSQPKRIVESGTMKDEMNASVDNTRSDERKREKGKHVENVNEDDIKDKKKASEDNTESDESKRMIEKGKHVANLDEDEDDMSDEDDMNLDSFIKRRKKDVTAVKNDYNAGRSAYCVNEYQSKPRKRRKRDKKYDVDLVFDERYDVDLVFDEPDSSMNNPVSRSKDVTVAELVAKEAEFERKDLTKENDVVETVLKYQNSLMVFKNQV